MPRSNAPLALSVVTLTVPGDVEATFRNITAFDDQDFGFNHNQTWAALPKALAGEFDPDAVARSFRKTPPRVQRCIVALCRLGKKVRRNIKCFADFPEAGLKTVESIDWDPEVRVRVKASCWYVIGDTVFIPVLQPRKMALDRERLAIYITLVKQAYCQGDWVRAQIELIDLSGDGDPVARSIDLSTLPTVSDKIVSSYVQTFVEAKKMADRKRAAKPKKIVELPMAELLEID